LRVLIPRVPEAEVVSLFAAEAHARTDREEVLLSRLFGILEILDREAYLGPVLREAGIEIAPSEYASMQIQFWPEMGSCGPDVALESDSLLVFAIGRERERVDRDELVALARGGRKLSPRFHLLVLTEGAASPPEVEEANAAFPAHREPPCRWLGWPSVFGILHRRLREAGEKPPVRGLVEDFLGLLAAEGRAPFLGFDPHLLREHREALPAVDRMAATARLLVSDLDARATADGIRRISVHGDENDDLPGRAARALDLDYADEAWGAGIVRCGSLFLRVDLLAGEIEVGFRSRTVEPAARALLVEGRQRIAGILGEREDVFLRTSGAEGPGELARDASALAPLETQNGGSRIERVEILTVHDGTREDAVPSLAASLASHRDLARSIPLLPLPRTEGESPFVVAGQ
jgi:hypothetical protein